MFSVEMMIGSISGAIVGSVITSIFQKKLTKKKALHDKKLEIYSSIVRNMELILLYPGGAHIKKDLNDQFEIGFVGEYIGRGVLAKEVLSLIGQLSLISNNKLSNEMEELFQILSFETLVSKKAFHLTYDEWLKYTEEELKLKIIQASNKIGINHNLSIYEELNTEDSKNKFKNYILKTNIVDIEMVRYFREGMDHLVNVWERVLVEIKKEIK